MVILGDSFTADFPAKRTWSQSKGWQTTRTIRGLVAELEGFVADLFLAGVTDFDIDPEPNSPYATLTYTLGHADDGSPTEQQVLDVWTLQGNDLEKTLWDLPKVKAVIAAIGDDAFADIRKIFDREFLARTKPSQVVFSRKAEVQKFFVAMYADVLKGVEVFPVSQYVLHRSITVNPGTNLRPGFVNVGKILTSAQLMSSESVPDTILFTLPDGFWLKRTPTVDQLTNGKFQFSQEWWHADSYSTFVYDHVT